MKESVRKERKEPARKALAREPSVEVLQKQFDASAKEIAVLKSSTDPSLFAKMYLPEQYESPPFHGEIFDKLSSLRLAIAAPRSFAKSTIVMYRYAIWKALTKPGERILMVSETAELAETWTRKIKHTLEASESLRRDFGPQETDKWTESFIQLANGSELKAIGTGKQVRGRRPTTVLADDVESDEMVRSPLQREKVSEWFWKVLVNTMEANGQLVVIGTILHPSSLLSKLLMKKGWTHLLYSALQPDGSSLWPEKWPSKALEARKEEIGSMAFASEFQNAPVSASQAILKSEWIIRYEQFPKDPRGQFIPMAYYISMDPAISMKDGSDPTAVVVLGIPISGAEQGRYYVVESWSKKLSALGQVDILLQLTRRYRPVAVGIEAVAYQQALVQLVKEATRRAGLFVPVHPLRADRDKIRRVEAVAPLIERGDIVFHPSQVELIEQLLGMAPGWLPEHDDEVDALCYAVQLARERPSVHPHSWHEDGMLPDWNQGLTLAGVTPVALIPAWDDRGVPEALRD